MKFIELTKGEQAIADDEDFEFLSQWKWYFDRYAMRNERVNRGQRKVLMRRVIMNTPEGFETDHINRNKLNNRKANLRICTTFENQANKKKSLNKSSIYKGVSKLKDKWISQVVCGKRLTFIGLFNQEHHAALAADLWNRDLYGQFARTNFKADAGS
jgi:hypothetical protein